MHSAVCLKVLQVAQPVCRLYVRGQARAEVIVASKRGAAIAEPYRDLMRWPRLSSATSGPASRAFPAALYVLALAITLLNPEWPVVAGVFGRCHWRRIGVRVCIVSGLAVWCGYLRPAGGPAGEPGLSDRQASASRREERTRQPQRERTLATTGSVRAAIFSPALELLFVGHPTAGAAWWLRQRGPSLRSLQCCASVVEVHYGGDLTTLHQLNSAQKVIDAGPGDCTGYCPHYLWAWVDKAMGHIRARVFAPGLGSREDGETGAAAVPITDDLSGDLVVTQGEGSVIYKSWRHRGWVALGGRVIHEGRLPIP